MWFKIKVSRTTILENGKEKTIIENYLTDALHFADAGYKVLEYLGEDGEVEDVCMMKQLKPSVNEYVENSKIFIVKIAEDCEQEDGSIKTLKYAMPVYAKDTDELNMIMKDYIKQGLEDMRLTTISETKWIFMN